MITVKEKIRKKEEFKSIYHCAILKVVLFFVKDLSFVIMTCTCSYHFRTTEKSNCVKERTISNSF